MLPFKKNGKSVKRLASHVSWQQEAFQSDDVGASSIRFRLNNSHRYTPILSSYFHFLESIDISNVYVVFSFHESWSTLKGAVHITDYKFFWAQIFVFKHKSGDNTSFFIRSPTVWHDTGNIKFFYFVTYRFCVDCLRRWSSTTYKRSGAQCPICRTVSQKISKKGLIL